MFSNDGLAYPRQNKKGTEGWFDLCRCPFKCPGYYPFVFLVVGRVLRTRQGGKAFETSFWGTAFAILHFPSFLLLYSTQHLSLSISLAAL